ncbi:MAG: hypothetical protein LBF09_06390 [Odoribacteraceae bacterium]|jgi:hypothetical protein|nr:hypothetical protein [Odoribacteraceae bacterium]
MRHATIYIIALLLAACYEDKGNYTYNAINEITFDTTSTPTTYTAEVSGQLVIDPVITATGALPDPDDLAYEWYFYSSALTVHDWYPVSHEKKLDITMIYNAGTYRATLYVTNKKTNLTSHFTFNVNLISRISHGILAFNVKDGVADFDYIATPSTVRELTEPVRVRDAFRSINGRSLEGNPLTIAHTALDGRAVNSIYVSTDKELLRLYARNFLLDHDANSLLVPPLPSRLNFEYIDGQGGASGNIVVFINDGVLRRVAYGVQYYTDPSIPSPQFPGTSLGDVYLANAHVRPTTSGSMVANLIFYDTAGKRFVYLARYSSPDATLEPLPAQNAAGLFDVNNIGKDLRFLDRGYNFFGLAVFSGGPGDCWLYEINLPQAYNITTATDLSHGKHDMSALPGIDNAIAFDAGTKGHFFLYATERDIYTCDYQGANPDPAARVAPVTATRLPADIPANEQITGIKIYKYDGGIYSQGGGGASDPSYVYYAALNSSLLYVSTWDGSRGHLYEFAISPVNGTLESSTPLYHFGDLGRIVDLAVKIQYRESY